MPGKRKEISTSPMLINNRLPLIAVYSGALLAVSEDISIKGEGDYRIRELGYI
jgi:hypothetical protein